jgi:predicted AAA+ superfamily ATPase
LYERKVARFQWLTDYVRTYLERDVRDLADFRSLDPFVKAQQITALLTGQLVNYSTLAAECGISSKTAQRFLQYLELSYQTLMLQPWHRNSLKRLLSRQNSITSTRSDARHFSALEKLLDKPLLHAFILSNDPAVNHIEQNMTAIPAGIFLS